jgi:hypothetical protein
MSILAFVTLNLFVFLNNVTNRRATITFTIYTLMYREI